MTLEVLPSLTTATNAHGPMPLKTREVVLLGYAEDTRLLLDSMRDDVEVWGINMANAFTKRKGHYWFQLHPRSWATGGNAPTGYYGRPKEHLDFLRKFEGEAVWMLESATDIPKMRLYPRAEIASLYGEYLTSTFAYMLALALYEHDHGMPIQTVHLFGINLSALEEYAGQRPCAEYWLGRLEQAGVRVDVPAASALLKGAVYPKRGEDLSEHGLQRHQHLKEKYMVAWALTNTALAMQTELKHWAKFLSKMSKQFQWPKEQVVELQAHFDKRFGVLEQMGNQFGADVNGSLGAYKDNQHWLGLLGAHDFKAPALPALQIPSDMLIEDFSVPEEKKI